MKTFLLSIIMLGISAKEVLAQQNAPSGRNTALEGLRNTGTQAGLVTEQGLPQTIGTYINGIIGILGIVFLVLTVYGGFRILLSRGERESIQKGRETILYGVIGMIVIALSYALSRFVLEQIIGAAA